MEKLVVKKQHGKRLYRFSWYIVGSNMIISSQTVKARDVRKAISKFSKREQFFNSLHRQDKNFVLLPGDHATKIERIS